MTIKVAVNVVFGFQAKIGSLFGQNYYTVYTDVTKSIMNSVVDQMVVAEVQVHIEALL